MCKKHVAQVAVCIAYLHVNNMAETPPTIYLLYGNHDLAFSEFVLRLREKMGEPSTANMNIDTFTPSNFNLANFQQVCASFPFLSRRRLVILEQPTQQSSDEQIKDPFFALLESLPETTALILIENVDFKSTKGKIPKKLSDLIHWLENHQPSAYIKRFEIPHGPHFVRWIRQLVHELGGEIEPHAAQLLAEFVNEDPHLTLQECSKLLDYVNYERPIEVEDIEKCTPFQRQSDVFAMVDAIGQRNGSQALQWLRQLLQDDSPIYAFGMIVRQFRLLLLTKEVQVKRQDPKDALHLHPYVAGKIIAQAKNFSLEDLQKIYHHLKEIDLASKIGQDDLEVSLERFVAQLTT
jgi:DNA polymerase-3 subunit delta